MPKILDERDIPDIMKSVGISIKSNGSLVHLDDAADCPFNNIVLHGKSIQDGTPTASAPIDIVSVENPTLEVCGSNLISFPYADGTSKTMNGITYTVNADGSILINGTATENSNFTLSNASLTDSVHLPKGWVSTSLGIGYGTDIVQIQNDIFKDGVYLATIQNSSENAAKRNLDEPMELRGSRIKVVSGVTANNVVVYPMFCLGEVPTPYEQGKKIQKLNIPSCTLCGIPVSSGGNYTDANGQQWICDEVDFDKGKYIQRVKYQEITSTPKFNETADQLGRFSWACLEGEYKTGRDACLSNYGTWRAWGISDGKSVDYFGVSVSQIYYSPATTMTSDEVNALFASMIANGTPPAILAQLETPIETDLTDEQLEAFASMQSHKGITNVLTDDIGDITVEYVGDLKTYIDKKIAESVNG